MKVWFNCEETGWMEIADCPNEWVAVRTAQLWAVAYPDELYGYGEDEDHISRVVVTVA